MGHSTYILRNMLGRRVRTVFTVLGLGVAVSSAVMLISISTGFDRAMRVIYRSRGIDLIVVRAGISDQLSSNLDAGLADVLRAIPGVREVSPSLMDAVSFEEANLASVLASGWVPGGVLIRGLRILEGRALEPNDNRSVILGRVLALNLGKKVGDPIEIAGEPFRIVGIYQSLSLFENGGLVMHLAELQRMMGRQGQVTGFVVIATPGTDPRALGATIEAKLGGVAAMPVRDYIQGNIQLRLAKAMSWATAAIALVVGSIGLLNTMAMAVSERTPEIGLLRALGWRRRRVICLLLGEAGFLGLLGALAGVALAFVGMRALMIAPTSRGYIDPHLAPAAIGIGLLMGLGLSLLGGTYPALRASRLEPTEALRHV
jgi:putative ABC transport system permease protein